MATFTYNETKYNCSRIFRVTNGGSTYSANLAGTTFEVLPTTSVVGDYILFLYTEGSDFYTGATKSDLYLYLTQAQIGGTIVWEYMDKDNTWQPLINLTDNSSGFTVTGSPVRVRFPRQPCAKQLVALNGAFYSQPIRARLTAGTITQPAIHSSTKPQFGSGRIYIYNAPSTAPATLSEIYTWVQANCPEVNMTMVGSEESSTYPSRGYHLENASILPYNLTDSNCYLQTNGDMYLNGNGSTWYESLVGYSWLDGTASSDGNSGFNGSLFVALSTFKNSYISPTDDCAFYNSTFTSARYIKTYNGKTYNVPGAISYAGTGKGTWVNCTFNSGFGYWNNATGTIKRCNFKGRGVTYTFSPNQTLDDLYFYYSGAVTGLFMLYRGNYLNTGKMKGLKYSIPTGSTLFALVSTPNANSIYNFLDPEQAFPTNNDGAVKFLAKDAQLYYTNTLWHIREYNTFNVSVKDTEGNALEGVTVVLENPTTKEILFTETTASDGTITEQQVMRQDVHYVDDIVFDNNINVKLTLSKAGYQTQVNYISINGVQNLQYSLSTIGEPSSVLIEGNINQNNLIGETTNTQISSQMYSQHINSNIKNVIINSNILTTNINGNIIN